MEFLERRGGKRVVMESEIRVFMMVIGNEMGEFGRWVSGECGRGRGVREGRKGRFGWGWMMESLRFYI